MKAWLAIAAIVGGGVGWSMLSRMAEEGASDWATVRAGGSLELPPRERRVTEARYAWPSGELQITTRSRWRYELQDVPVDLALAFLEVEDKEIFFYRELKDDYVVSVQAAEESGLFRVAGGWGEGR